MKLKHYWIFLGLGMLTPLFVLTQDFSNKGKEFWLSYSYHVGMVNTGGAPQMTLYITSDVNTNYSVEIFGGNVIQAGSITAGQVVNVVIPNSYFIDDEGFFKNKAIRVTGDKPIVVYSYITRSAASAATLCLPTNVLGKEYYSFNFTQLSNEANSNSFFTIVAVEDNTAVEITPAADTKSGWKANSLHTINLNKGEIYQVLGTTAGVSGEDLTGSHIRSVASGTGGCKRIAVFSGSGKIRISSGNCASNSSDNLYQQLYPTGTWGKKYLTVPSYNRPNNYYRITISDPASMVYVNGTLIPAGSFANNYYQFFNNTPNLIESDKPISVAQFFTTENCDGNGNPYDPDMIVLNPVEQNIDKVTLVSSNLIASPPQHHIHVIMRNGGTGLSSFTLDGSSIATSSWTIHPADPGYSYLYLNNVTQGYHRLASDSGFNAIAYGYAPAETYGYSAGANVKDLYQFVSIKNQYATVNFPSACKNSPFYFSMTFPYQPTEIRWQFNGLFTDVSLPNPVFDSTWSVNGKQLYLYKLPTPYIIANAGTYPIKVLAQNPTSDGCSGEQEINYDLQVFERPVAAFDVSTGGCLTDSVRFTDNSNPNGRPAIRWSWDFADGDTSGKKNPVHLYTTPGSYNIKYSVITDIGCLSDTAFKTVTLNDLPIAKFGMTTPACIGRSISFSDSSSVIFGNIIKWTWSLGDGTSLVRTSNAVFTHAYATTGSYAITLKVETDKGCSSVVVTKQVVINPLPKASFGMPDNCLADPFSQFTDSSFISDGTQSQFSYLWNFGDATGGNANTSTLRNPQHRYAAAGNYNVSLVVTSGGGCADTITKSFTLNGSVPQSVFLVNGGLQQCSNNLISITNNSSVDIGRLVRLEIFWDYSNDPTNKTIVQYPTAGTVYDHRYPEFFTPASQNFMVRVVAYSGDNCLHTTTQTITLKATPEISFAAIPSVCADLTTVQITQAGVLNGVGGTGVYSGTGINATGLFNPKSAGVGPHTIRYTFSATNGCSNFKEQTINVFPVPNVTAGPDRFVLEGGFTTLLGSASGNNLSYSWSPSTWLSNASVIQPVSKPADDITYTLTVRSADGCTGFDQVFVKFLKTPVIPNTFSPNGDGIHDTWEITSLDSYPGAVVDIYNRYGQLVFQSFGYTKPWDGTIKGKPLPAGTYYYIINPKNGRKQMAGFVDIIR